MSIYENNLRVLKSKFPKVYDWILKEGEDERIEIIRTRSGLSNLRFKGLPGQQVCLYGMNNPMEEEIERCKDRDFSTDRITFLIGIGLGYILDAIKRKMQKGHKVIVFENNATILRKALSQIDMTTLLLTDGLILSLPDDESLKENVVKYTPTDVSQIGILAGSARGLEAGKEYLELKEKVFKISTEHLSSVLTAVKAGTVVAHNEIANIPKFLFSPGIKNLFNRFENIPGIVISAGPSLERNVHLLKRAMGKALLVATLPVVRVLLAYDIKPDLMISIDFQEGNRIHFEGLWDCRDIPLMYPIFLSSSIVRDFQGNMFAIQGHDPWLSENWENKGTIKPALSVAGYALKATLALGCDPVILVGQDLSYSDKTHIEGSARSRKFDQIEHDEEVYLAQGVYGQPVLTCPRFFAFLHEIEDTIASHDRRFINATPRGLSIKGTEELSLRQSINRYCGEKVEAGSVFGKERALGGMDLGTMIKDLRTKIEEIKDALNLCVKGLRVNRKINKTLKGGLINTPVMQALVQENERIGARLQTFYDSFRPLGLALSKDFSDANRHEYIYRDDCNPEKNLSIYVERNDLIFSAYHRVLKELSGPVSDLFALIKKIKSSQEGIQIRPADGLVHYRYGKILAEIGLHGLAVGEYTRALELGLDQSSIYQELGRSSLFLGELKRSREYFREAQARAQDLTSIQRDLQEIEEVIHHWLEKAQSSLQEGNWVNALLYARKVIREDPVCEQARRIEEIATALRDKKVAEMEEANEREREQREREKSYTDWVEKGKELFSQREFAGAIEALESARQIYPDQSETDLLRSCCYSEIGNLSEAERILEGLIRKFPESGIYPLTLGQVFLRNGNILKGAEQLEKAAAKEKQYFLGFLEAGTIYMKVQDYHKAIECFGKYLEVNPESYELLGKIGTCFLALGMLKEAKGKYGEALKIQPAYVPAQIGLQKIAQLLEGRKAIGEVSKMPKEI